MDDLVVGSTITYHFDNSSFVDDEGANERFIKFIPKQTINPYCAAYVFYYFISDNDKGLSGSERRQLLRLKENYYQLLANIMYDYILIISVGELRWTGLKTIFIESLSRAGYIGNRSARNVVPLYRNDALNEAIFYSPKSIIRTGKKVFKLIWHNSFGGISWYRIVTLSEEFGKISNEYFIDKVYNVRHNGGFLFDRETIFKDEHAECDETGRYRLQHFLNKRANGIEFPEENFQEILQDYEYRSAIEEVLNYKPIVWGDKILHFNLERKERINCQGCGTVTTHENGIYAFPTTKDRTQRIHFFCRRCIFEREEIGSFYKPIKKPSIRRLI